MHRICRIAAMVALTLAGSSNASACTGITIRPKDGSIIAARTLEFAADTKSNVIVLPRGQTYVGSTSSGKPGVAWKNKYGIVGANAFGLPVTLDGLNEKGLAVGLFYFPGYAKYENVKAADLNQSLAPWELGVFLLGTCSDIREVVQAVESVHIGAVVQSDMGFVPPVHYIVTDAQGNSVVLEPTNGKIVVHANPLGVITNSPTFDWHMTNLSNYVNLTVTNVPPVVIDGNQIKNLGQGSGLLGLPGDFTPPSRFVRAVAFARSALPAESAHAGVLQAFHILNQFDIPRGAARDVDEHGHPVADYTLWTSASDLKNLRFYFRTYENSRIRMVDLKAVDLDTTSMRTISMQGDEQIEDLSPTK